MAYINDNYAAMNASVNVNADDVDLSGYVLNTLKIAGIDLADDITATELRTALGTYPVLFANGAPTSTTKGGSGQLLVNELKKEIYMCLGKTGASYNWHNLTAAGVDVDLSGYVLNTLKIAGIDLADDITVEELQEALNVFPFFKSMSAATPESEIVGQLEYCGSGLNRGLYILIQNEDIESGHEEVRIKLLTDDDISNGEDGRGIESAEINASGELVFEYNDNTSDNLGVVVGPKGDKGDTGAQGPKGDKGDTGAKGADGTTPVKGVDYFTDAEKAELVADVTKSLNADGLPQYWLSHLESKIATIREIMQNVGANKSAFFFYTDSHWSNDTTYTAKLAPALLKYLSKHTPINKTNFGGDIVSAEANDAETMAYLWEWRNLLYGLPNHHSVVGNHDDGNNTNNLFTENYVYSFLQAPEETPDIIRGSSGMYYYIDNNSEKTRYLYLDTAYKGVDDEQREFVKSALLTVKEGWHVVVIAHAWYENDYTSYPPVIGDFTTDAISLLAMFDAYNARTGEYASCGGYVEFCIGGHYHLDYVQKTAGGIPVILCEADAIHDRSGTMPQKGTTDEAAVSVVIADYKEKVVNIIRIGRGDDYEITIDESNISYTNVIPISIDSTGAIFNNGNGWADTSRIGSGTLENYIGSGNNYITGHIELDPTIDNTICLKNIIFKSDTTDTQLGVAFYDSNFKRVNMISNDSNSQWLVPSSIANTANGYDVVFDGTNILQFTLKNGTHIDNPAIKYFAICAEYIGADSIITINEPIE